MDDTVFPLLLSYVKGFYSFGLMETNFFDRAEELAREVNCLLLVLKGFTLLKRGPSLWVVVGVNAMNWLSPSSQLLVGAAKEIKLNMETLMEFHKGLLITIP